MPKYNLKKDIHHHGYFKLTFDESQSLPENVDLRVVMPDVYNQGEEGSCAGNASGGLFQYDLHRQGLVEFMPSRNFIYWNARNLEGTISDDSGCSLTDCVKVLQLSGVCDEVVWPYDVSKFNVKPSDAAFSQAITSRASVVAPLASSLQQIKQSLAAGNPVILGMSVFASFEGQDIAKTGMMPMPLDGEKFLGGHAVMAVGYDEPSQRLIIRNSWGREWGVDGHFCMPYEFVTPCYISDCWTITQVI